MVGRRSLAAWRWSDVVNGGQWPMVSRGGLVARVGGGGGEAHGKKCRKTAGVRRSPGRKRWLRLSASKPVRWGSLAPRGGQCASSGMRMASCALEWPAPRGKEKATAAPWRR
jgi:hypothetical protein